MVLRRAIVAMTAMLPAFDICAERPFVEVRRLEAELGAATILVRNISVVEVDHQQQER